MAIPAGGVGLLYNRLQLITTLALAIGRRELGDKVMRFLPIYIFEDWTSHWGFFLSGGAESSQLVPGKQS